MPLAEIPRVAKLSPLVLRVLGHNPGSFQLQGANMYIVGSGASRLLIDAGQGMKEDLPALLKAMADDGAERISDVVSTHFHHDHTEGLKGLRAHFGEELRMWKLPWSAGVLMPWPGVQHGPSFDLTKIGVKALDDLEVAFDGREGKQCMSAWLQRIDEDVDANPEYRSLVRRVQ